MQKGILIPYFETGMEAARWAFYEDGKEGYEGLFELTEDHHLKVFDEEGNVFFEDDIIKDTWSKYEAKIDNPIMGRQIAGNLSVEWIQIDAHMGKWLHMFSREYSAELTKTTKSKEDIAKIKLEKKEKYLKERSFKVEVLIKPKLFFNLKSPQYYQKTGDVVIVEQLMSMRLSYHVFDGKIYLIYVSKNSDEVGKKVLAEFIKKENFNELKLGLGKDKNKFIELNRYLMKNIGKFYRLSNKEVLCEKELKFKSEYAVKQKKLELLKMELANNLMKDLIQSNTYMLGAKTGNDTAVKLISFSEKDSKWLLKLKS